MDFQYIVHGRNIVELQRGRDTRRTKNQNFMSYIKNVFPVPKNMLSLVRI